MDGWIEFFLFEKNKNCNNWPIESKIISCGCQFKNSRQEVQQAREAFQNVTNAIWDQLKLEVVWNCTWTVCKSNREAVSVKAASKEAQSIQDWKTQFRDIECTISNIWGAGLCFDWILRSPREHRLKYPVVALSVENYQKRRQAKKPNLYWKTERPSSTISNAPSKKIHCSLRVWWCMWKV